MAPKKPKVSKATGKISTKATRKVSNKAPDASSVAEKAKETVPALNGDTAVKTALEKEQAPSAALHSDTLEPSSNYPTKTAETSSPAERSERVGLKTNRKRPLPDSISNEEEVSKTTSTSKSLVLSRPLSSEPNDGANGNNNVDLTPEPEDDTDGTDSDPDGRQLVVKKTSAPKRRRVSRLGLKKGEKVGQPRAPGSTIKKFNTKRYATYDWEQDSDRKRKEVPSYKGSFAIYDDFKLVTGKEPSDFKDVLDTPTANVRLDDRWIGKVSRRFNHKALSQNWPAEFDVNGMVRAARVPLGEPCLIWVPKGTLDIMGKAAKETGAYYAWFRGLQLLCGNEGLQSKMFQVRPSHEIELTKGLTFKQDHKSNHPKESADFRAVTQNGVVNIVSIHRAKGEPSNIDNAEPEAEGEAENEDE